MRVRCFLTSDCYSRGEHLGSTALATHLLRKRVPRSRCGQTTRSRSRIARR